MTLTRDAWNEQNNNLDSEIDFDANMGLTLLHDMNIWPSLI